MLKLKKLAERSGSRYMSYSQNITLLSWEGLRNYFHELEEKHYWPNRFDLEPLMEFPPEVLPDMPGEEPAADTPNEWD